MGWRRRWSLTPERDLQIVRLFDDMPTTALATDGDSIWAGTPQGLRRLNRDGQTEELTPLYDGGALLDGAVEALWADGQGSLWIGIDGIVAQVRLDTATESIKVYQVKGNRIPVTAIRRDMNGNVWISTAGDGVLKHLFENGGEIGSLPSGRCDRRRPRQRQVRALASMTLAASGLRRRLASPVTRGGPGSIWTVDRRRSGQRPAVRPPGEALGSNRTGRGAVTQGPLFAAL